MVSERTATRTVFERNPKKTLVAVVLVLCGLLDVMAAQVMKAYAKRTREAAPELRVTSKEFDHDLRPNVKGKGLWGHRVYSLCTNSLAFRDREPRDVPLVTERHRIVFIGDSFTEGVGVAFEDSFVGLVETALAARSVDVLNAAGVSYSPAIYFRKIQYLLDTVGLEFHEVVVFLDISDIQDEALIYDLDANGDVIRRSRTAARVQDEVILSDAERGDVGLPWDPPASSSWKSFLVSNTVLPTMAYRAIRTVFYGRRVGYGAGLDRSLWTVDHRLFDAYGSEGLEFAQRNMDRLASLLKERGIKLTVAVYPWIDQINHHDLESRQVTVWKAWAARNGAGFLNYFPLFVANDSDRITTKYFIPGDVHWNEKGHRLVADELVRYFNGGTEP